MNIYEVDLEHVYNIAEAIRAKMNASNLTMTIDQIPDIINVIDPSSSTHIVYPKAFVPITSCINYQYRDWNSSAYILTNNLDNIPYGAESIYSRGVWLGTADYSIYKYNSNNNEGRNYNTYYVYSNIPVENIYFNNLADARSMNIFFSRYIDNYNFAFNAHGLTNNAEYNLINNRDINLNAVGFNTAFVYGPNNGYKVNFLVDNFWKNFFHNYTNLNFSPFYICNEYLGYEESIYGCKNFFLIDNKQAQNKINNYLVLDYFNFRDTNYVHYGTPSDISQYEVIDVSNNTGKAFIYKSENGNEAWLNVSGATNWSYNKVVENMFYNVKDYNLLEMCEGDLSKFDYSKYCANMFRKTSANNSLFLPSYIGYGDYVYADCLDIIDGKTGDMVISAAGMFSNCKNLSTLEIGKNVKYRYNMIGGVYNIQELYLNNTDSNLAYLVYNLYGGEWTQNISNGLRNMKNIFLQGEYNNLYFSFGNYYGSYSFNNCNIIIENINNIQDMYGAFQGASFPNIIILNGKFNSLTNFAYTFENSAINNFYGIINNKNCNMYRAFNNSKIEDFILPEQVNDFSYCFNNCKNLNTYNTLCPKGVNNFTYAYYNSSAKVGSIEDNVFYFSYCYQLTKLDNFYDNLVHMREGSYYGPNIVQSLGKFNNFIIGKNVQNVSYHCCGSGYWNRYLPNGSYDYESVQGERVLFENIDNVIDMSYFANYSYINDFQYLSGNNVKNMYYAFYGSKVRRAGCGPNVTNFAYSFTSCSNLRGRAYCGDNVINMYSAYSWCYNLLFSACGNKVENMSNAFSSCYNLKNVTFGANVRNIAYTYSYCYNVSGNCTINFIGNITNSEVNAYQCFAYKNNSKALNIYMHYNSSWGEYVRNGGDMFGYGSNPWSLVDPANTLKGYYNSYYNVNIRFFEDDTYPYIDPIVTMPVELPQFLSSQYIFNNFVIEYNPSLGKDNYTLERKTDNKLYLSVGEQNYSFITINNAFNNCKANLSSLFVNSQIFEGVTDMNGAFFRSNARIGYIPSTADTVCYTYFNCDLLEKVYYNTYTNASNVRYTGPFQSCYNIKYAYFNNTMVDSYLLGWSGISCSSSNITDIEFGNNCFANDSYGHGFQGLFYSYSNITNVKGEIPSAINYLDGTFSGCSKIRGNLFITEAKNISSASGFLSGSRDRNYRLNVFVSAGSITNNTISNYWTAFTSGGSSSYTLDIENNCYYDSSYNIYVYYN